MTSLPSVLISADPVMFVDRPMDACVAVRDQFGLAIRDLDKEAIPYTLDLAGRQHLAILGPAAVSGLWVLHDPSGGAVRLRRMRMCNYGENRDRFGRNKGKSVEELQ